MIKRLKQKSTMKMMATIIQPRLLAGLAGSAMITGGGGMGGGGDALGEENESSIAG
jgi:hypothetical protein